MNLTNEIRLHDSLKDLTDTMVEEVSETVNDNVDDKLCDLEAKIDDVQADLEAEDDNLMANIDALEVRLTDLEHMFEDLQNKLDEVLTDES